ncbi:MAG TPA: hypothetical protein ENN05_05920 [Deltaproteobacteria bacterium]|nr:hypothetical protein [Deltaproteobacteria bacterium]
MVDIHLCQPDKIKSCAACCGIYNYVDNNRASLTERFNYRTRLFSQVRTKEISIDSYREIIRHREDSKRIYKTIYTCEFVGFLNEGTTRVGCMLHPMSNDGLDMRDISFYGRDICDGHFCPSFQKLTTNEASTVLLCLDDWYLYGSVITDIDFVKTFFSIANNILGEEISSVVVESDSLLREILRGYFSLKERWPYRDNTRPRFGKYYFVGEEYDIDRIDYEKLGCDIPVYDPIFLSLSSQFRTTEQIVHAVAAMDDLMKGFCNEYSGNDRKHN